MVIVGLKVTFGGIEPPPLVDEPGLTPPTTALTVMLCDTSAPALSQTVAMVPTIAKAANAKQNPSDIW